MAYYQAEFDALRRQTGLKLLSSKSPYDAEPVELGSGRRVRFGTTLALSQRERALPRSVKEVANRKAQAAAAQEAATEDTESKQQDPMTAEPNSLAARILKRRKLGQAAPTAGGRQGKASAKTKARMQMEEHIASLPTSTLKHYAKAYFKRLRAKRAQFPFSHGNPHLSLQDRFV